MIRRNIVRIIYLNSIISRGMKCIVDKWDYAYIHQKEIEDLAAAGNMSALLYELTQPFGSATAQLQPSFGGSGSHMVSFKVKHTLSQKEVVIAEVVNGSTLAQVLAAINLVSQKSNSDLYASLNTAGDTIIITGSDTWEGFEISIDDPNSLTTNGASGTFSVVQRRGDILTDCITEKQWNDIYEYALDLAERCCCKISSDFVIGNVVGYDPHTLAFPFKPADLAPSAEPLQPELFTPLDEGDVEPGATSISIRFDRNVVMGSGVVIIRDSSNDVVFTALATSQIFSARTLTINTGDIFLSGEYTVHIPPGFVKDTDGNSWAGTSSWKFNSAGVLTTTFSPAHNSDPDDVGTVENDVYVEFNREIEFGSGTAQMWGGSGEFDGDSVVVLSFIAGSDGVEIQNPSTGVWRLVFRNRVENLASGSFDIGGVYIPSGFVTINGVAWAGTLTPPTDWKWDHALQEARMTISSANIADGGTYSSRGIEITFSKKLSSADVATGIGLTAGGSPVASSAFSNSLVWPYNDDYARIYFEIPLAEWNANTAFVITMQAAGMLDRNLLALQTAVVYNISRQTLAPTATVVSLTDFVAASNDPSCSGAYTAVVEVYNTSNVLQKTENFSQNDFPTNDLISVLEELLPATYRVDLAVTDCNSTSNATNGAIVRPVADAPVAAVSFSSNSLSLSASAPAPYNNGGEFSAVLTVTVVGGSQAYTATYDQDDIPGSVSATTMGLTSGTAYEFELVVTDLASESTTATIIETYTDPCASIVYNDLSGLYASHTDDSGNSEVVITLNSSGAAPTVTTMLDDLQARFPSTWEPLFDNMYEQRKLISPRTTRAAYSALFAGSVPVSFNGPYGIQTWRLLSGQKSGNAERPFFIKMDDGRIFLMNRQGSWNIRIWWVEDPTGTNAIGTVYKTIDFQSELSTDSQNTMDEIRVIDGSNGLLLFPVDTLLKTYDIISDAVSTVYTSGLGNIGTTPQDRQIAGSDGNKADPFFFITHGDKFSDGFNLDPRTGEIVWEELTGSAGSYAWEEIRYPASNETDYKFSLPSSLDYAVALPDGSGVIAAIDGGGTVLYSNSGVVIGEILGSKNHYAVGWFRENDIYKPCVVAHLSNGDADSGPFTGMYLKDVVAVVWDVSTDVNSGTRSLTRRAYKMIDWNQNPGTQFAGQFSLVNGNRDYGLLAASRNNNQDDSVLYPYSDQIILMAMNNDTAYPAAVIDETMALIDTTNTNKQSEAGMGPFSDSDSSVYYTWSRGEADEDSNQLFLRKHYINPSDADITANLTA